MSVEPITKLAAARWYAIQVHSPRTAAYHLSRQDFVSFFPALHHEQRESPLFPGYGFVRFSADAQRWQAINGTLGVAHLLPVHRERPLSLPEGFVEQLLIDLRTGKYSEDQVEQTVLRFMPQERVKVISGPLAGKGGHFLRARRGALVVLMSLLGRELEVIVPRHHVAKSPEDVSIGEGAQMRVCGSLHKPA